MRLQLLVIVAVVLSLGAEAPKEDAVKKDLKKAEGMWVLASGEEQGEKLPEATVKSAKMTLEGDKYTLQIGEVSIAGTHKIDPTQKPKTIDATHTERPFNGQTMLGIYKLDGDRFTVCVALPSKERPKEFTTKSGTGAMLYVWKRVKK